MRVGTEFRLKEFPFYTHVHRALLHLAMRPMSRNAPKGPMDHSRFPLKACRPASRQMIGLTTAGVTHVECVASRNAATVTSGEDLHPLAAWFG